MAKPALQLTQGQNLVMTPQLQQAIKLLQMPTQELTSFVGQELLENPFLGNDDGTEEVASEATEWEEDVDAEGAEQLGDDLPLDFGWDSMYDAGTTQSAYNAPDDSSFESFTSAQKTLKDHLVDQLGTATTEPALMFLGKYLIDAIDDAGYLRLDASETAEKLQVEPAKLEEAIKLVQTFDPAGVGARSLAECLALQLEQQGRLNDVSGTILANLDLLAKQDFTKLAKLAKCDVAAIAKACGWITDLTPKPGLAYGSDVSESVTPDVVVLHKNGAWQTDLNAEAMPKLLLNRSAEGLLHGASGESKTYLTERMSRAQWLLKSLEQRARTILRVSRMIVQEQQDFFNYGVESLKPMTLKAIADRLDIHESTVSRVTNGKYMQTPMGVFELKYFFNSAIGTTGGSMEVAAASVKAMIKRLVEEEDLRKPLSDEKLVELLKAEGIDIARRTVAKYREALHIPSSSGRRMR